MPDIKFYANFNGAAASAASNLIDHSAGSGIGFYGSSFGASVPIGSTQTTTFVTNSTGTTQASQLNNTAKTSSTQVSVNGADSINLNVLPNYLCPLNVRFTADQNYKVQNCKLRIFDRTNIENHATGVTTHVYEARHPAASQSVANLDFHGGASELTWVEFTSGVAMADMTFTSSPGMSGTNTNSDDTDQVGKGWETNDGASHANDRHDWYIALSSSPITVGSKTQYGLYFTVEYLS
tara:strand:+ start:570 stop:1280 length:711 start_codon:yes stop_codon:yes gene_type:complete